MSITALMSLFGAFVMIASWAIVSQRIRKSATVVSQQIRYLKNFFLHMGLFCICLFLPQLALSTNPSLFPILMAWGYIIGHVFAYIAFTYVLRLTFSMVPRLAHKQKYAVMIGAFATIVITAVTIATMIFGTLPEYDSARSVILFNVAPVVGALIGIFATLSVLPAAVLMIINGIHNPQARVRSFLLGGGLFIVMTSGPMHDVATSWQIYMTADILSVIGFIVLTTGIVYRFEERIVPVEAPRPVTVSAS